MYKIDKMDEIEKKKPTQINEIDVIDELNKVLEIDENRLN